jgi:quercetin dioxygenase-like cupin family protein
MLHDLGYAPGMGRSDAAPIDRGTEAPVNTADGSIILMPGRGRQISLPARGAVATLKAVGADTGGRFSIVESAPRPGAPGLAMHRHRRSDEALYVLEGAVTVCVGDRMESAPAGSFAFIPRGVAHMFWNPGPRAARVLVIFAPAGVERFLEETADAFAAAQGQPDPELLHQIRTEYDTEMVETPPLPQ